jgi:hypothetical protein
MPPKDLCHEQVGKLLHHCRLEHLLRVRLALPHPLLTTLMITMAIAVSP